MKRNFKNTSAKVLAVALAVGMVATSLPATVADAKKAVKKPTLGKTKVSINVGKTAKITVKKNKGPKVKKVTIKLSAKQKKLVKITKKTKSYIKVKGLKAGKTTLKVKIKAGKKTYTQKLTVTVVKGTTPVINTPAPTTATSNKPADSTPAPSAGTNNGTPAPSGATESQSPSTTAPAESAKPQKPDPLTDLTLKYDYAYPAARQVLFEDADEGYPAYGIDVRDYEKIVVKVAAVKAMEKVDGWAGKVTISATDEGSGMTPYTDGFYTKYFNDMPYEDGVYTFTFDINAASLAKGWEFDDLELVDCIGLQLSGTGDDGPNSYDDITLKEISLIARTEPLETPDPNATAAPTGTPIPTIDPSTEKDTAKVGDITLVTAKSDITTLKAGKDASGTDVVRFPFTKTNQRVFFDVSAIDFTEIDSIKITADVPAQMTFDLFSKDVDKEADSWWNGTYVKAGYPFYQAEAGKKTTYTCMMTTADLKDNVDLTDVGYLALGSHNGPAGKDPWATASYLIYSIEFVKKTAAPTKTPEASAEPTKTPEASVEPTKTPEASAEPTPTPGASAEPTPTPGATAEPTPTPEATPTPTPEASITFTVPSTTTVVAGKTLKLTTNRVYPEGTSAPKVTYTSSNVDIATVSGTTTTGTVTGKAAGKVTITASITVNETEYTDTIEITVQAPPAEDISINLANATGLGGAGVSEATADSVKLTFNNKYNQSIKVSVEIPEGEDLKNYYGFSFDLADLTFPEDDTTTVTYKSFFIETQGENATELTGIDMGSSAKNVSVISSTNVISSTSKTLVKESFTQALSTSTTKGLDQAKTTTGTIELAMGINDIPVGTTIVIKNVKLLAVKPA